MKQAMKEQLNCFLPLGIEGVVAAGTGTASGTATGTGAGPRLGARLLRAAQEALDARPGQARNLVALFHCASAGKGHENIRGPYRNYSNAQVWSAAT